MNIKTIAAIVTIGLLAAACDKADERDVRKTADPAPAHRDASPATTPAQQRKPDYADRTRPSSPDNGTMQKPYDNSRGNSDVMDIEGKELISASGEELGEVDRVVLDRQTGARMAVIGLKGIVGAGAKEVLVPMSQITMSVDGNKVVTNLSKQVLEARPDVDMGDFTELPDVD